MTYIETILEILKYTIPAVIVYLLIRQFLRIQAYTEELKTKSGLKNDTLAMRMQAYERLVLFSERIRISNLLMRLQEEGMSTAGLKNVMLIAIQKEFEHNLTQQLYISGQLWEMIQLLKDETIAGITSSFIKNEKADQKSFITDLYLMSQLIESKFGATVKKAIKKEVQLYFQ